MKQLTGAEAVKVILAATSASDLFGDCGGVKRRIVRTYRILAFAVHPDRAEQEGISEADATCATRRLNELFEQADPDNTAKPSSPKPHLVGEHGTYWLGEKIRFTDAVSTYATSDPLTFAVIARTPDASTNIAGFARAIQAAADGEMGAFVPTHVDGGTTSERAWMIYTIPEGLHSLREVHDAYPDGLDARDWAWMYRRILMILDTAGAHGNLTLDTVLIHPEHHGVVLMDFQPGAADLRDDAAALWSVASKLVRLSTNGDKNVRSFIEWCARYPVEPGKALDEFDLILARNFGPRTFRPFTLNPT